MEWLFADIVLAVGLGWRLWQTNAAAFCREHERVEALSDASLATAGYVRDLNARVAELADRIDRVNLGLSSNIHASHAGLDTKIEALTTAFNEHGPHVREHDCRFELSSVENDGIEHHYRCTVDPTCKARFIMKIVGRLNHALAEV